MKCKAAHKLFSAAFDGELSAAEERDLKGHLSSCPACSREFGLFSRSVRLVSSLPRPSVNPFFEQKLLRELRTRKTLAPRVPLLIPGPAMAFAAALVFVALLVVVPQNRPNLENGLATTEPGPVEFESTGDGLLSSTGIVTVPSRSDVEYSPQDAAGSRSAETRLASSGLQTGARGAVWSGMARDDGEALEVEFVLDPFLLEGTEVRRIEASYGSDAEVKFVSMTF